MVCIYCRHKTEVINSRPQKRLNHIWRRRQCLSCGAVFTTSEVPELAKSLSVIKDKHLEPFSRDQLFISIYDSLKHRKTALTDAGELTSTVVSKLLGQAHSASVKREHIISATLETLNHFDKPAATHYAAFHLL